MRVPAVVVCLVLSSLFFLPQLAFGQSSRAHVSVRIYDYVNLPREVVEEAPWQATRVLAQAGVDSEWLPCRVAAFPVSEYRCGQQVQVADIVLSILNREMAARFHQPKNALAFSAIDPAEEHNHRIWVFYDSIRDLGEKNASLPQILGHVEAHEIGHILMHSSAHSLGGLMRAHWSPEDLRAAAQGRLLFTQEQAEAIRTEVGRRWQLAQAAQAGTP